MTRPGFLLLFLNILQTKISNLKVLAADGCKEMEFTVTLHGKSLANHVFKAVHATGDTHCESQCYLDDRCISYSFDKGTNTCELSDSDHVMHPGDLVNKSGVVYRRAENTCSCRGNQTCRYDFVRKTGTCVCSTGLTGQWCEIVMNEGCYSNPCVNGGTCENQFNGYICKCPPKTSGIHCETASSEENSEDDDDDDDGDEDDDEDSRV